MPDTPSQTDTYNTALDIFDKTHPLRVDVDENLKVTIEGPVGPVSGTIQIEDTVGHPITTNNGALNVLNLTQLIPYVYDYISLSYTGNNLTTVVYKTGGASGTTIATLALTYDGSNNLLTVTRS
jgi:hypothetical protein